MKVVVSGASGFVGQALLRRLADADADVVGVSRRRSGAGWLRVSDLAEVPAGDVLVHLAEDPVRARANEGGDAYHDAALDRFARLIGKGYARVVYASSAVLYGAMNEFPCSVESPVHVVDTYTGVKRASEVATLAAGGVVARLSNLYGPGMSDGNVLSTVLDQVPGRGEVVVNDDSPIRDFLWIDDAADAMAQLVLRGESGIYNVGSGVGTSIRELAGTVLELAGESHRPIVARRRGFASQLVLDVSRTTDAVGWRSTTPLREGLRRLLASGPRGSS